MNAQFRVQQEELNTVDKDDCGCGCGGAGCGGVRQELVFVGSLDRYNTKDASEVCGCDGSCGCGGYRPIAQQDAKR